ncbi:unnamed protein product, partial [Protopolystoma xenopodis]
MAKLTDDADYYAGETFEKVPSPLSDAGNHDHYYGRRLRTRHCELRGHACLSDAYSWPGYQFEAKACLQANCSDKADNGRCDPECNLLACQFDHGDCLFSPEREPYPKFGHRVDSTIASHLMTNLLNRTAGTTSTSTPSFNFRILDVKSDWHTDSLPDSPLQQLPGEPAIPWNNCSAISQYNV